MKIMVAAALALTAAGASAQTLKQQYPSCDLKAQRALKGDMGGSIKDATQAHIAMRANIPQADIGNARKARRLTQAQTDELTGRVDAVRAGADGYTQQQGFLSAAEKASYDRELDAVAGQVCHR